MATYFQIDRMAPERELRNVKNWFKKPVFLPEVNPLCRFNLINELSRAHRSFKPFRDPRS